jgi:CBS domain-containing protein
MINRVKDWMSKPAIVVDPDSSVSFAMTLMRRRNIHSLVVEDYSDHTLRFGIITTTDIRDRIIAEERNPSNVRVREIMSAPVVTANPEWTLKECSIEMQLHRIHHMPVVDEGGTLVGMISVTDIFRAAEEIGWEKST